MIIMKKYEIVVEEQSVKLFEDKKEAVTMFNQELKKGINVELFELVDVELNDNDELVYVGNVVQLK